MKNPVFKEMLQKTDKQKKIKTVKRNYLYGSYSSTKKFIIVTALVTYDIDELCRQESIKLCFVFEVGGPSRVQGK